MKKLIYLLSVLVLLAGCQSSNNDLLLEAAYDGDLPRVEQLIKEGVNVNWDGGAALHMASQEGHLDVVKALLTAGADVNVANKDGGTALSAADQNGHTQIANLLRQAGATK